MSSAEPNGGSPGAGWSNGAIPAGTLLYSQTIPGKTSLYDKHRRWIGLNTSWSRIGEKDTELSKRTSSSSAVAAKASSTPQEQARQVRALMAQLCEQFYRNGWATGTGGGISIRIPTTTSSDGNNSNNWRVFVAPSGVQKEDLIGDDMFELDMEQRVVAYPASNPNLRQSACTPLWFVIYKHRPTTQAVLHTHSPNAVYATLLDPTEQAQTLRLTHLEMLKGVGGHAYDDVLELPIIDNRPTEDLLADQLKEAVLKYPAVNAVLVRRHGLYAWGDSWEQCKTIAESVDYLLAAAVQMKQLGVDPGKLPPSGTYRTETNSQEVDRPTKKLKTNQFNATGAVDNAADCRSNPTPLLPRDSQFKALLLDIEGCTTSIAFVKEVLFPFVRTHLASHLQRQSTETLQQLQQSLSSEAGTALSDGDVMTSITTAVHTLMDRDQKSPALKSLQGQMWQAGYINGTLQGHVYADVRPALEWMSAVAGVPVYIYSSGSIQAQKLLFGNSTAGMDLLPLLKGHFDITTAGNKKEASSYTAIAQQLQLEPAEIVFCSDAVAELVAAQQAGIGAAVMTIRPGNAPLSPSDRDKFGAIHSLLQLCGKE